MKKVVTILPFLLFISLAHAQVFFPEVISTAGNTYPGTNMTLSWTIGEFVITDINSAPVRITQGFNQPWYSTVGAGDLSMLSEHVKVYPNPIEDQVNIAFEQSSQEAYGIMLIDGKGKLVRKYETAPGQTSFTTSLAGLCPGLYCMIITTEHKGTVKVQKIIKK
jgi:hypothetical protein